MSPMSRAARPDPVEVAGARLRALRLVPAPPAADHEGMAWSEEPTWGGWVPDTMLGPMPAAERWDHARLIGDQPAVSTEAASTTPPESNGPAVWDQVLARLPLPLAGVLERLGWRRAAALGVVLLVVAAAVAGGLVGRHLAAARPPVAQSLPDLGVPSGPSDASGGSSVGGSPGTAAADTSSTAGVGAAGSIVVDVEGRVRHPGLVTLPAGARVADAVQAAGGLRGRVHDPSLDLAARVGDGQLLGIGRAASAGATADAPGGGVPIGSDPSTAGGAATTGPLNLNTASEAQLEALPGVGPVLAGRILAYRQQHGSFAAVSALQDVPGIGPSHFAEISPLVTT